jgi:hypothetical protein
VRAIANGSQHKTISAISHRIARSESVSTPSNSATYRIALAVASLTQGIGRIIDPTGAQFGDVGVSHQSNPAPA